MVPRLRCRLQALAVALAAIAPLAFAVPASASTVNAADYPNGPLLGLGFTGLSYDHGFGPLAVGAMVGDNNFSTAPSRMKVSARGLGRFYADNNLAAAVIAGVQYDPGVPGSRAYLVPDAGFSLAYTFAGGTPLTVRLNVTLTVDQYAAAGADDTTPRGNVLQRLVTGPNTGLGIGLRLNKNLEVTLGGGTWVGARLNY